MAEEREVFILNVGKEPSFQDLRHRLLVEAGYTVASVVSVKQAEKAAEDKVVDVLVVGAWVPKTERNQVVRLAKASNPKATIIFYYDQNIDETEEADAILNFRGDHSDLVRTVQHLLARATKRERTNGASAGNRRNLAGLVVAALSNNFVFAAVAAA